MTTEALTKVDMAQALNRLAVLPKPKDLPDAATIVDVFHARCRTLPRAAVLEAATQLAGSREWFPRPSELYESACDVARASSAPRRHRYANVPGVVCTICGSRPRLAVEQERNPRTGEVHERQRYHAPCDPERHEVGDSLITLPPTFVRWAE